MILKGKKIIRGFIILIAVLAALAPPNDSIEVDTSITQTNLSEFKFNWNGTNYSFYDSSLVLAMNFNNNPAIGDSATKAVDISKYRNDGTIYGASWTTSGKYDSALEFDGVNDYVDAGTATNLNINGDISIEAWIYPTDVTDFHSIVSRSDSATYYGGYNFYIHNNRLYANLQTSSVKDIIESYTYDENDTNTIFANHWYHVVVTKNATDYDLYINGFRIQSQTPAGPLASSDARLSLDIGGYWYARGAEFRMPFKGMIDEVRVWNRTLSPREIGMQYQSEFQKYNSTNWRLYIDITRGSNCSTSNYGYLTNNTGNPVGGGTGYSDIYTTGDYVVSTKAQLLNALSLARSGQVVFVTKTAQIDLTGETDIVIPAGVTLASGRGDGRSSGAFIYSTDLTKDIINGLFDVGGNGVRITGLRLQGPDTGIRDSSYGIPISTGIYSEYYVEVDNNEISGWALCGICIYHTNISASATPYVHHNYIHHNRRYGLGYGISIAYGGSAIIESNIFDWNRHSIAGWGTIDDSYTARYNLVLGHGNSHGFDMHGGADRLDGTNIAGKTINIYNNTFYRIVNEDGVWQPSILIRGIPTDGARIYNNYQYSWEKTALQAYGFGNMSSYNNCVNGFG